MHCYSLLYSQERLVFGGSGAGGGAGSGEGVGAGEGVWLTPLCRTDPLSDGVPAELARAAIMERCRRSRENKINGLVLFCLIYLILGISKLNVRF